MFFIWKYPVFRWLLRKSFRRKPQVFLRLPRIEICLNPNRGNIRKMLHIEIEQKLMATLSRKNKNEYIKYYWEKQNKAIWISHLTQQSFINFPILSKIIGEKSADCSWKTNWHWIQVFQGKSTQLIILSMSFCLFKSYYLSALRIIRRNTRSSRFTHACSPTPKIKITAVKILPQKSPQY